VIDVVEGRSEESVDELYKTALGDALWN
jgi:hypothetical protein